MKKFYKVMISKEAVGSAILHKEPALQGKVIIKVTDSTTAGNFKLFVIDCDDDQNKANTAIPGVEDLSEDQAVELAAQFQPKRTLKQFNPITMKDEKINIPACDLKRFY